MAYLNILTFELCLFIAVLLAYSRLNKTRKWPLELVRDLTVYLTPTQEDFDVLQHSSIKPRESMKGKPNKFDAKRSAKQAKFPMRTHPLNEELLKYYSEYFGDYDFLFMLFTICVVMALVMSVAKLAFQGSELCETSMTMWLTLLTLFLVVHMLCRDTFALGYTKFTDETKVQILFAVKSFMIVWIVLSYTTIPATVLGVDVDAQHELMARRVNSALKVANGKWDVPYELTYFVVAGSAAVLTFSIVKINISFGYYFYAMTKALDQREKSDDPAEGNYTTLKYKIILSFLGPLLLTFLYVHDLVFAMI